MSLAVTRHAVMKQYQTAPIYKEATEVAKKLYNDAYKAVWFAICVQFTAEALGMPVKEVAHTLNKHGIVEWLLSGYDSFHTQGYEYISELITDKLRQVQEIG